MMKRFLPILFAVVLLAGCSGEYFYDHVFTVDNQSGETIEVLDAEGETVTAVESGVVKEIFAKRFQCSRNAGSVDYFPDENSPVTWWSGCQIKVGDEVLPQEVWLKKYWKFTGGRYRSDYTLTVDEALLAELQNES